MIPDTHTKEAIKEYAKSKKMLDEQTALCNVLFRAAFPKGVTIKTTDGFDLEVIAACTDSNYRKLRVKSTYGRSTPITEHRINIYETLGE